MEDVASVVYAVVAVGHGHNLAEAEAERRGDGIAQEAHQEEEEGVAEARGRADYPAAGASRGQVVVGMSCDGESRGRKKSDGDALGVEAGSPGEEDHTIHCGDTALQEGTRVESAVAADHQTMEKELACQ